MLKTKSIARAKRTVIILGNIEIFPEAYVIESIVDQKNFL